MGPALARLSVVWLLLDTDMGMSVPGSTQCMSTKLRKGLGDPDATRACLPTRVPCTQPWSYPVRGALGTERGTTALQHSMAWCCIVSLGPFVAAESSPCP